MSTSPLYEYRNRYIPVHDSNTLSYQCFVQNHLLKNQPVIIKGITSKWPMHSEWLNNDKSAINDEYLCDQYGDVTVEVAQCGQLYGDEQRATMSLKEYLEFLAKSTLETSPNPHSRDLQKWLDGVRKYKISKFDPQWTADKLYCKDWHIVGALTPSKSEDGNHSKSENSGCQKSGDLKQSANSIKSRNKRFYETPMYFEDDWLNHFCDRTATNKLVDFRFCYLGPQCSWTALHHDVYSSYSWSANILGQKLWIVFSPEESRKYLQHCDQRKNESIGHLLALIGLSDTELEEAGYPHLKELFANDCALLNQRMIIQNENEAIFVPSMWYHEVYNLSEVVLSVNHNWFNAFNLKWIWKCIHSEYQNVCKLPIIQKMRAILDVPGMANEFMLQGFEEEVYGQTQKMLRDVSGIDFEQFIQWMLVNAANICHQVLDYEATCDFVMDDGGDGDDASESANIGETARFRAKCNLFSLKTMLNLIDHCIGLKCLNDKHTGKLKDIETEIHSMIEPLKFVNVEAKDWKLAGP